MRTRTAITSAFLCFSIFTACNSEKERSVAADPQPAKPAKESRPINCYHYTGKGDTISLKLIHVGESITGTLIYKLSGKDMNQGTIQGSMQGGLLLATYTFQSEGVQSMRQVAFKQIDGGFVEGYGETAMKNDMPVFKDSKNLSFNDSMKLAEYNCK